MHDNNNPYASAGEEGSNSLDTGGVRKPSLEVVGMLAIRFPYRRRSGPDGQRSTWSLATGHEAQHGVIDDHVHRHGREIHEHDLGDRPHSGDSCPYRSADDGLLGNRRGADTRLAVLG